MRRLTGFLIAACFLQPPAIAAAADAPSDSIPSGIPQLADHRFVPVGVVPAPFVRTYLRNSIGLGSTGNLETPPIVVGGAEIVGLKGSMFMAVLDFEYQLALKRWLALRAQVGLAAQTGTEVNTLLAEGVGTALDFQVGWLVGLAGGEKTQLSVAADISNRSVTALSVRYLVEDIVAGADNIRLTRKTPVLNGTVGVRGAWAISNLVGLNAVAEIGNGETTDRNQASDWFYRAGLGVSLDLDQYGLPLGAALAGVTSNFGGDTVARRDNSSEGGFKLSYIGRDAFLLSFFVNWARVPTDGLVEDLTVHWTGVSLQYFF